MKSVKKTLFMFMLVVFGVNFFNFNYTLATDGSPYDQVLSTTIHSPKGADWWSLESVISTDVVERNKTWADVLNEQVKDLIWYVIDIFIVVWIAMAFLWGYKIMTSNSEDKMKEWIRYVVFGVLWILIMMSAKFLAAWLVWNTGLIKVQFQDYDSGNWGSPNWILIAQNLYDNIMYPFIKVALYLVIWALFFIMAAKVITFVISTEEAAKKKAGWIILWCVVGIMIVMWSKQIVEAVMWKQDDVLKVAKVWSTQPAPARIDDFWNPLLEFWSIPLIAQIINWVMWLTMFAIVVLIIIQGYRMFTKPDDPKNRERLKKTMLYVIIWVLVIWAAYVISNVLVLNWFNTINWWS